jgi:hypothetical protein
VSAFSHFDTAQLLAALQYLTILFFVAGGAPFVLRRRRLRWLALLAYGGAVILAVLWVVVWLANGRP